MELDERARCAEGAAGGDMQNAVLLGASDALMRAAPERVVALRHLERAIGFVMDGMRRLIEGD